jgi:hypothetical protein
MSAYDNYKVSDSSCSTTTGHVTNNTAQTPLDSVCHFWDSIHISTDGMV